MRLAVLASGRGSNFEAIAAAIEAGRCAARVVSVVSDRPDAGVLERATARGIETAVVPLEPGADRAAWDRALAARTQAFSPDLVVLAGFMRIVGRAFLDTFPGRIINVHPSLLPAFPGAHAPRDALAAGVRLTGCTVHLVDEGVDTGATLGQAAVPVLPSDDVAALHARIQRAEHQLLPHVIDLLARSAGPVGGAEAARATPLPRPPSDREATLTSAWLSTRSRQ